MTGGVVLVTGADKGIGFEVARTLAGQGIMVWLAARGAGAGSSGGAARRSLQVKYLSLDVAAAAGTVRAARRMAQASGRLNISDRQCRDRA